MNETTLTIAQLLAGDGVRPRPTFYQRLILEVFAQMHEGYLRMELPDGTTLHHGTPGHEVSAHIRVARPTFFKRCVLFGDVGFGESYVDGDWETESIERVIAWAILNIENTPSMSGTTRRLWALNLLKFSNRVHHLLRPNSPRIARQNIAEHYDLGNDFYHLWLDPTMTYSSAKFSAPDQSLEAAQIAKYDTLCRKLRLGSGDHLLEIGSGWGGMASHAVRHYGCRVTTVTISQRQYEYARERFAREGIADRVDLRLQDYREITGRFDKVVSIEMMEALGDRYLETFFAKLHEVTKPDALIALQYITVPDSRHAELRRGIDFIQKHIFPGSLLLSIGRVNQALHRTGTLSLVELEDIGLDYARTLRRWFDTFTAKLDDIRAQGFDDRFIRKWSYYLQYCEAAFEMRNISVVHALYSRPNNPRLR
ncbi:MAG: cyclopropane-fatty-acyl-phospholipid synthase family protein [Chthoniobacteraceae bacterium]